MTSKCAEIFLESIPRDALSTLDVEALTELYNAVGWTSYTRDPNLLMQAFLGSDFVLLAKVDTDLLGVVRVVSDDASIAYIQDIIVHPNAQRKGVGKAMLNAVLHRYRHVRQKVLLTDDRPEQIAFYAALNFKNTRDLNRTPLNAFVHMDDAH